MEVQQRGANPSNAQRSVDLIMPKQFAVQTRTMDWVLYRRRHVGTEGMNDEFICIYNSLFNSHSRPLFLGFENFSKIELGLE